MFTVICHAMSTTLPKQVTVEASSRVVIYIHGDNITQLGIQTDCRVP